MADQYNTEVADIQEATPITFKPLPYSYAKRHGVLLKRDDSVTTLYFREQLTTDVYSEVVRAAYQIHHVVKLDEGGFNQQLAESYQGGSSETMEAMEGLGDDIDLARLAEAVPEAEDLLEQEDDAPIIRLINAILSEAIHLQASDIHIETFERRLVVRFRVDGVMRKVIEPKRELASLLVSRIKVMAKLDIAEKRIPQDGRISLRIAGREVDIRVSTLPSSNGERVVLRLLDKQAGRLDLNKLGLAKRDDQTIRDLLFRPHGIILVTGPTGSGKTTTLYASLAELNAETRTILTVEDPIEYNLEGIGQTQVNTKTDMTFARGLRAILRQDPDVVMVGEIRDMETAQIAVQASLTGHLVLSTLHTNTAIGAITRLKDMGIEPFLLASSLIGMVAQRLVRVLCDDCKAPYTATVRDCRALGFDEETAPTLYHPKGCEECNNSGYRGRLGIYEVIAIDETLRTLIHTEASEQEIAVHARKLGPGIRDDGKAKVLAGLTTVEEVLRVTQEG
ncbi:type II secretion system ATPase GspE [Zooshikella marina]|uniref:type II secretion system ATPase GspE n=1 Tax=Zooshikella ganghwensis TaxID=202772 RepID=UPI001BB08DC3|nr:type II secretion system ATPase GspE [Zooshikella ganghwensis]MBU2706994.1 type II secretion system ATPase GspE [Zooshikella ganghwensis]